MRYIKLVIPVKTYVRKYIEAKHPGFIKLNSTSTIGALIFMCVEKQYSNWHRQNKSMMMLRYQLLTDKITVMLPGDSITLYSRGFTLPAAKATMINDFFEDKINEEISFRCDIYNKVGYSRRKAIDDFCDEYKIEIDRDITYAALKKAEYRFRTNLKKSLAKVSPV